ncbi:RBBP9/YdeN family alpha/beta hydrolase [Chryseosolibacter indicus]|uniref:Alpha/beta hydrolase n=1 Tax=Chryseosolibacter indicus TaxID=2782351 RepID=A0ABS5VN26_9BACT|nr:alpha/beta hydrolase [Chryseosolibacter indicus]MBT1702521.1 alpha/beta hydrolase [Chryseosolibacter indicus]
MHFNSKVLIHPGLNNSGEKHWQSQWEKRFPQFTRIEQIEWDNPVKNEWIATIDSYVLKYQPEEIILVGHSLACCAIAYWSCEYKRKIKGALLVAPSDTEADSYPPGTTGFTPMPLEKLHFPSITVTSTDDRYVTVKRAKQFADAWGSKLVDIGPAGHINSDSNLGSWEYGLQLLKQLDL